jgi:hypothetical protein
VSFFLRLQNPKHIIRKIKGEQWRFPENDNNDSDVDSTFELGDEIETFNYAGLVKVIVSDFRWNNKNFWRWRFRR